jgi:hypothetical protein
MVEKRASFDSDPIPIQWMLYLSVLPLAASMEA